MNMYPRSCPPGSFGDSEGLGYDYFVDKQAGFTALEALLFPSFAPSTVLPSPMPSAAPVLGVDETLSPSKEPTVSPVALPTAVPTVRPPTAEPTAFPTCSPVDANATGNATACVEPGVMGEPSSYPSSAMDSSYKPTFNPTETNQNFNSAADASPYYCSGRCPLGHYCPLRSASGTALPCPAGRYGAAVGLTNDACTAEAPLGYYALQGSITPTKCPGGVFGASLGLVDAGCSKDCWMGMCKPSRCRRGFYCPPGSIVDTEVSCGEGYYCPLGSAFPLLVTAGFYSVSATGGQESPATHSAQRKCERGYFCVAGRRQQCPAGTSGSTEGLQTAACSATCNAGHYCPAGSTNGTQYRCPSGRFGAIRGLKNSECSGYCKNGFYCPEASLYNNAVKCAVISRTYTDAAGATAMGVVFAAPYYYIFGGVGYSVDFLVEDVNYLNFGYYQTE
jgi:hypothetical protein